MKLLTLARAGRLLVAAAIATGTPAHAGSIMDAFNRAHRDAAGLSTPQERTADRIEAQEEELEALRRK